MKRLGNHRQDWIKNSDSDNPFTDSKKKFSFLPIQPEVTTEMPKGEGYPFTAIIGSLRYHLGTGSRTSRSERVKSYGQSGAIEISAS